MSKDPTDYKRKPPARRSPGEIFKELVDLPLRDDTIVTFLRDEANYLKERAEEWATDKMHQPFHEIMREEYDHSDPEKIFRQLSETLTYLQESERSGKISRTSITKEDRKVLSDASNTIRILQNTELPYATGIDTSSLPELPREFRELQEEIASRLSGITVDELRGRREASRQNALNEAKKYDRLMELADELCQSLGIKVRHGGQSVQ